MCMFPELNGAKPWSHSFYSQNSRILQIEWAKVETLWKWILKIFKSKNEFPKWGHLSGFNISFPSYGP